MEDTTEDRCTFSTSDERGNVHRCKEKVFCRICGNCAKHCLQHMLLLDHLIEANQIGVKKVRKVVEP